MGDDFRKYGLKDVARASDLIGKIVAWVRDLRHSVTESIDNEVARTRELSEALTKFNTERLGAPSPDVPPFDLGPLETRTGQWMENTLNLAIPNFDSGVSRRPLDSKYYLCSQDDMAKIIGWDWTDHKQYQSNRFDCEDFAFRFKSRVNYCFGLNQVGLVIDWSGGHSYNCIVFPGGGVWFFEPQSDTRVDIGTGLYEMKHAEILI